MIHSSNHKLLSLALCLALSGMSHSLMAKEPSTDTKDSTVPAIKVHQGLLNDYKPEKVADHTWVIHGPREMPNRENQGFMNNPAFIITEKSVVVIDPGATGQIGRAVLAHVKKATDKPVTHVFNTHVHGDHWLGNQAFKEAFPDVKIYAHPKMIEEATDGAAQQWVDLMLQLTENLSAGTEAVIPAIALEDGQVVKIDNISIKTHLSDVAHTRTDAMFEIIEDKVLFTGDNVTHHRLPRMDDGSFRGNIATVETAKKLPVDTIVPGHGATGDKKLLDLYQNYLSTIYETAKVLAEEGLESFEMKPKIMAKLGEYKDWPGLEEELGKHISLAVLEAEQAEFE